MTRVMDVICKQMEFLLVPSQCQRHWTLTHHHQEMELDIRHHKGGYRRRQTQNTTIQCSSSLWRGYCKNMPHLILQNCWLRETRQCGICQNFGATFKGKETCACTTSWKKCMIPNYAFYHAQSKEMDSQYAVNVCTVLAPGMEYIWRHGAADIQGPSPLGSNHKRERRHQDSGGDN